MKGSRVAANVLGVSVLFFVLSQAWALDPIEPSFPPGYRPDKSSDEGGFWSQVDKLEDDVRRSPQLIVDTDLNRRLDDLVCRLAGEYCPDIRVYLVKNPYFNASMYPNGMMHIWTGLLLRVENEAQLAAVLGHEIGHYLRAHMIERWRGMRDSSAIATFLDFTLTGGLATLAVAGSSSAFGREQEMEADQFGLHLMAEYGYAPKEAAALWKYVRQEESEDKSKSKRGYFLATHPQTENRIDALELAANQLEIDGEFSTNQRGYVELISPYYFEFMNNHFDLQELEQTELLLEKHLSLGYPKGEVYYFKGRLALLRKNAEFQKKAEAAFLESLLHENAPVAVYKELAYLYLKTGKKDYASIYFNKYLEMDPEASDRKMIEFYLSSLGVKQSHD